MSSRGKTPLVLLVVLVDAGMAVLAFYLGYRLRALLPFPTPLRLGPFANYIDQLIIQVISLLMTFFFYRLYHVHRNRSRIDVFYNILSAVSIATFVSTASVYLIHQSGQEMTRGLIVYGWGLTIVLTTLGRLLTGKVQQIVRSRHPDRLLIVGTGDIARMLVQKTRQSPQLGYEVVGFCDEGSINGEMVGIPVLGTQAELDRVLREHDIHEVVITRTDATHEELLDMISACEAENATVRIFPDLFQIIASELTIGDLDGLPLLTVRDVALRGWKLSAKRLMDLAMSAAGLVALSPFMLFVAFLIKVSSKGPVFYAQTRVGLDGKPFEILKFRSMRVDAESETGPKWASADDPRKTRLGTLLRRTSIDELPQLINVLLGEMSIVGPRPERPMFVDQFKQVVPRYMERHKEKAGITGWAQVNGLRGDTSIIERTKYDLYYIENWSLLFDIKIILRTVLNQFRGDRNAY